MREIGTILVAAALASAGIATGWGIRSGAQREVPHHQMPERQAASTHAKWTPSPPALIDPIGVGSTCEPSLELCAQALTASERAWEAWKEQIEGEPIEWTPATVEVAGEAALRAVFRGCPGFEAAQFDCDEYPCIVSVAGEAAQPCLPPATQLGSFGYAGNGDERQSWWSIRLADGPRPDAKRVSRRGRAAMAFHGRFGAR